MPFSTHYDTAAQSTLPTVSSSSIITVKASDKATLRDPVVHIRSTSPAQGAMLAARAIKASVGRSKSGERGQPYDPFDLRVGSSDGDTASVEKWSHTTTGSSPTQNDASSPRRRPAQVQLEDAHKSWAKRANSPSSSPSLSLHRYDPMSQFRPPSANSKLDEYRPGRTADISNRPRSSHSSKTSSPRVGVTKAERHGLPKLRLPIGDMHNRPQTRSPLASPAHRVHTPLATSHTPSALHQDSNDYFGLGIDDSSARDPTLSPGNSTHYYPSRRPASRHDESPSSPGVERSRPKARERREKDKKAILSKALERANNAVVFDNALKYRDALDAYTEACRLLLQVMDRTSGDEDRRKLNAIRVTYTTRIEELRVLEQGDQNLDSPTVTTARPSSSHAQLGNRDSTQTHSKQSPSPHRSLVSDNLRPQTSPAGQTHAQHSRDSFLTDAIREVEGNRSSGFLGPLWERSKAPISLQGFEQRSAMSDAELHSAEAPLPLTPVRSRSPSAHDHESATLIFGPSSDQGPPAETEAMSWLNTIEESESDDATMLHFGKRGQSVHRKDIQSIGYEHTTSEFDAAFDAAVEAAYEDGFELDSGEIVNDEHSAQAEQDVLPTTPSHREQRPPTADSEAHGFDFNLQNPSSLPATSNSSRSSHETWQTSVQPDRDTANTSLSLMSEGPMPGRKSRTTSNDIVATEASFAGNIQPRMQMPGRSTSIASRQSSIQRNGSTSGGATVPYAIKTSRSPSKTWGPNSLGTSQPDMHEVAPWEIQGHPDDTKFKQFSLQTDHENGRRYTDEGAISAQSLGFTMSSPESDDLHSPRFQLGHAPFSLQSEPVTAISPHDESMFATLNSTMTMPLTRRDDPSLQMGSRMGTASSTGISTSVAESGGRHLFDTSLGRRSSAATTPPRTLEPCPDSTLLRPFWLLRCVLWTLIQPRGGYLTNRLFLPREAWLNRTVKLKNVEDKVAACDTLASSLTKLTNVNTYDAEAVLEELQAFEDVMERVQVTLSKRLGGEVGTNGIVNLFKDAAPSADSPIDTATRESVKMHSGKSYLNSWRKLRSKTLSGSSLPSAGGVRDVQMHTMATVPMTMSASVDKHTGHRRDALREAVFEGPLRDYMSSIAKLCEASQALDGIARQVEDPGLKHTSSTHVGLELSMRHAAEFFGLYICRFLLTDIGILLDKHVKRSSEWLMA